MSLSNSFQLLSFQRKVQEALQSVERTLELERNPRIAAEVDHTYGAKYELVNSVTNTAIISYMSCFEKLGIDEALLKSIDKTKSTTLRFDATTSFKFSKEVTVDVPVQRSYAETEESKGDDPSKNTTKTKVMKAINHVKEYHWETTINYFFSVYSGTAVEDRKVIKSHTCKSTIITQTKGSMENTNFSTELSLTWLMKQINTNELTSQFKVDTEDEDCRTPRRNEFVSRALDFAKKLKQWCQNIDTSFFNELIHRKILQRHDPAKGPSTTITLSQLRQVVQDQGPIFNPILPLMEEPSGGDNGEVEDDVDRKHIIGLQSSIESSDESKVLLSSKDISKLLNEHERALEAALDGVVDTWPSDSSESILSSSEATFLLLISQLISLASQYTDTLDYIESMMEKQLISAIGKRLTPKDLATFVTYHEARLLTPMPRPFSHAIRRPEHYPVGLLTIESKDGETTECIHTHSREVSGSTLSIPLNAATVLELTGQQFLHGYMDHRFGTSNKSHQLVARARQWSSYILVVGNMIDGKTLDPKHAIIIQNKDDLVIPLLLEELPTAKEFKDAIQSLSEEQQRFCKAYRQMQLASSVFGVCVIQIKPQLEALLGLPSDALDKEMKLTQDLMELFVEFQVPSDLLSYNGFDDNVAVADKLSNVKDNVKSVLDVINAEKEKQLKEEKDKTEMAMEQTFGSVAREFDADRQIPMFECCTLDGAPPSRGRRSKAAGPQAHHPTATPSLLSAGLRSSQPARAMSMAAPPSSLLDSRSPDTGDRGMQQTYQEVNNQIRPPGLQDGQSIPLSSTNQQGVDFTLIPQSLDKQIEKSGSGSALRSTTIKTGGNWVRNRQDNLLTQPKKQHLSVEDIKKEKNKAFDLLDALSRSGSLPIAYSELHVVVAVTHCFDKDVMSTVVCDNINPIQKLECSTLILASAIHGMPTRELIADVGELQRLEGALPLLFLDETKST